MRILYFHQHFSTPSGATGTRSYEMAQKLIARGHEVTMVCGSYNVGRTGLETPFDKGSREGSVDGIHVIEFDLSYGNADSFSKRALQFLRFSCKSVALALRRDYDVVFATSTPLTAGIPGIAAKWLRGKKFIFEVRDLWPELPKAMGAISNPLLLFAMSVLEKVSYRSADACVGLSPGIVQGIRAKSRDHLPVLMVPNGCDIALFNQDTEFSPPFTVNPQQLTVCFAGAHGMANGLPAILDAASILKQRGETRVKFVFVGEGKVKPDLIQRAKDESLDNCVFLNAMPKTELAKLMNYVDVGLMPLANVPAFYYGTSPNKFFDYISCGLPVVNNYPGWLADLINEHQCGVAVAPDDPEALAQAMVDMAKNKHQIENMGRNSLALAESQFCRDKLSERFVDFVEAQHEAHI